MILLLLSTLLLSLNARAFSFPLPAVPLAVRSPYLNSWLHHNGNTSILSHTWPTTFNRSQVCLLRISSWPLILTFNVLDPRVVRPRTSRRSDLFFPRRCRSGYH